MAGSEAAKHEIVQGAGERAARPLDRPQLQLVRKVEVDRSRDALLTAFGKATLEDRYLLPGESFQDMFARVSCAYADDVDHAQRLYDYMTRLWFMPATPILSNGGTDARACRSPASSTTCRIRWTASSASGTRMWRWPPMAAASAPIGARSAPSARR